MAGIDGEECLFLIWIIGIADEAFVLPMGANCIAVCKCEINSLEFTKRLRIDIPTMSREPNRVELAFCKKSLNVMGIANYLWAEK